MDAATITKPTLLPLGLHFGLDEDVHHADPALGSTDLRRLAKHPFNYWYKSPLNPHRPPPESSDTPSRIRGRAMHKMIYEPAEVAKLYVRGPDQPADLTPPEKSARTKAAKAEAAKVGKTMLPAVDHDLAAIAAAMITKNPELATVFTGGHSEVSFFWMRDGVRCKARFDYLKATVRKDGTVIGIGDLKSVANQYENEFAAECRNHIGRYRYDAQAAHYMDGARLIPDAIREGLVHGQNDQMGAWLERFTHPELRFAWQWVFHQTEGAPITWSYILSPENPILEAGRVVIDAGIRRYQEYMHKFGPNEIWLLIEKPIELPIAEMPAWYAR